MVNSKAKGSTGEREVAHILQEYGYNGQRGQQYCGLKGDADVIGLPGVHLEVKRVECLRLHEAMRQSKRDAREGEIPMVVHRRNREEWLAILPFKSFLEMYKAWEEKKNGRAD